MISSLIFLLAIASISILLCRLKGWLVFIFLPINTYFAYELLVDLYRPTIYESVLADYGQRIFIGYWLLATVLVISPIVGAVLGVKRRRNQSRQKASTVKA